LLGTNITAAIHIIWNIAPTKRPYFKTLSNSVVSVKEGSIDMIKEIENHVIPVCNRF